MIRPDHRLFCFMAHVGLLAMCDQFLVGGEAADPKGKIGARGGTRTLTGFPIRTSSVRVCHFTTRALDEKGKTPYCEEGVL